MCRHAPSPATLYAHVRQASAAARVGASRASASLATSAIAFDPPLSTTSRPCLSMSSSSASSISRRVLVFFESRPRTRYPAARDAGNPPGTSRRTARNFSRAASMAWPLLSTSAGRNSAASWSLRRSPCAFTTASSDRVKSSTRSSDCVFGACSQKRSTTHRRSKSRFPGTSSGDASRHASRCSTALMCALKPVPNNSACTSLRTYGASAVFSSASASFIYV